MDLFRCIHGDGMHQAFLAAFDDHCVCTQSVYTKRCLGIAVIKLWVIFAKGSLRDPAFYFGISESHTFTLLCTKTFWLVSGAMYLYSVPPGRVTHWTPDRSYSRRSRRGRRGRRRRRRRRTLEPRLLKVAFHTLVFLAFCLITKMTLTGLLKVIELNSVYSR